MAAQKYIVNELNTVELPLMSQLSAMGWETLCDDQGELAPGDTDVPSFTFRENFGQVLLREHVKAALYKLNMTDDGEPWLDEGRITIALDALDRAGKHKLIESNVEGTRLLLEGVVVPGEPDLHGGRDVTIRYIDFNEPQNNHFLAINQFRVDTPAAVTNHSRHIPDIVLFVNGIPLVVIECKAPGIPTPLEKAIEQLLQYSNQRGGEQPEGIERLFWYNQALVATYFYGARISTIGASYEHYMDWKMNVPQWREKIEQEVQTSPILPQQVLVGGILRPENLLDLVRHFTLFKNDEGRTIKVVARYQQWEAVQKAIHELRNAPTRLLDGEFDRRGGIIWHTQGSGKSLTMVFLVRKLRILPDLRQFKVVVVTDRVDLEQQLSETMQLTGENVRRAQNSYALKALLREDAPGLIFGMIQKYRRQEVKEREEAVTGDEDDLQRPVEAEDRFEALNTSTSILILIDEAHRSHTDEWHANMVAALPNSARIGFTGTPIMMGAQKRTTEIFGDYIDIYNIRMAEEDRVTVPIVYEGRKVEAEVLDHSDLDQLFDANFAQLTSAQQQAIKDKYAGEQEVLEGPDIIAKKAADVLRHYISTVLPNGFKAQLVAVSRLAAIRYQAALAAEHKTLVEKLERMDPSLAELPEDKIREYDDETQFLIGALKHLDTIRTLEFAAVISADQHDRPEWSQWTGRENINARIERFKKPLKHADPGRRDGLAILCVRTMLLTGFDAPIEQALYLDRFIQGHELLQAVARVNRTYKSKTCGYVVDYYGVTQHLTTALALYSRSDVEGTMKSIKDELPKLQDRHGAVIALFREDGIDDIQNMTACVLLLVGNERTRAEFARLFKDFLVSLDIVLPNPKALPYVDDAKYFGVISRTVTNILREEDDQAIAGLGDKVRQLIDDHIRAYYPEQIIAPLSITDANFEAHVNALPSSEAKAAEMEHAARHEIAVKIETDPVHYEKLSERLEQILTDFEHNWDMLAQALRDFIHEIQAGPPSDRALEFLPDRDAQTLKPFMSLLIDAMGLDVAALSSDALQHLAGLTVEIAGILRDQISRQDFWATTQLRQQLRAKVKIFMDDHDILPFEKLDSTADRIVELAKRRHTDLVSA